MSGERGEGRGAPVPPEVVAAIAAVLARLGDGTPPPFRVRPLPPLREASWWSMSGRLEVMGERQRLLRRR
ncbi:MAG: hypothetical protein M0Z27_11530 [Thermaerobacter sp.]|nr:hypothetical protein [Thermaerobacter sp.]